MYNIVELFSGIGSQAKALINLGQEISTQATCEWDIHAIIAYDLIHTSGDIPLEIRDMNKDELLARLRKYTFSNSGKEPLAYDSLKTYSWQTLQRIYTSIKRNNNFVDISSLQGEDLPEDIDIMTYSFPCQDLSNVGAFHGYNKGIDKGSGSRSSLLWQVGRILTEMNSAGKKLPRFLLMENVPTLLSQRHFANFSIWINDLRKLGYVSHYYELNASDFGLPQNRPRLLMISVFVGNDSNLTEFVLDYFRYTTADKIVDDYKKSHYYQNYSISDLLRIHYEDKKLFDEAVECTPSNTVSRQKIWEDNPQLVLPDNRINNAYSVIRTITTKQDRNPNSGNLYFDSKVEGKSKFRYLTPRECLLFMGFTDKDYEVLANNNLEFHKGDAVFARDKIIRMAGNSIPVKLLEGIFLQILQIDQLLSDLKKQNIKDSWPDIAQNYADSIRSALFKRGIRSRQPSSEYPDYADIVYSRYKAAVFVCDCFWHGHNCKNSFLPEANHEFWEKMIGDSIAEEEQLHTKASTLGWRPVIVWDCELSEDQYESTMDQLKEQICMR